MHICGRFRGGLHWLVRVRCLLRSSPAVPLSDNITQTNAYRPGKSALDEFLPELHVQFEREADRETIVRETIVVDKSRVQWWPMFAAALVGIGVSLLAFGAWARFGLF